MTGVIVVAAFAAGCQSPDPKLQKLSDDRFAGRVEGMGRTLKAVGDSEAVRPRKTEENLRWAAKDIEGGAVRLRKNWKGAGELLDFDMQRFFVRNPPLYQRKAAELMWCQPEAIGPNAITLLW